MKTPDLITDVVAPLGPNARAMLLCRCGHEWDNHVRIDHVRSFCKDSYTASYCDCQGYALSKVEPAKQPSPRPTVLRLLADTKAVILRRRQECYGGLAISDEQADELSRALVQNLLGSYEITGVAP